MQEVNTAQQSPMALSKIRKSSASTTIQALEEELDNCREIISQQFDVIKSLQRVSRSLSDSMKEITSIDMSVTSYSGMRNKKTTHRELISSLESQHQSEFKTDLAE